MSPARVCSRFSPIALHELIVVELKDDNHQVPRSSSLIARRLPASAKGRGNAQNYIVGTTAADALNNDHRIENHARDALAAKANKGSRFGGGNYGSMTKRFDGQDEAGPSGGKDKVEISTGDAEEDKRIQAFFAQSGDQWEQTQDDMAL
jgi:protein MPE1